MIRIDYEGVTKSFGSGFSQTRAVVDATWTANGGEVFGVLGPNGAGKTTTIRMLLDIFRPDSGVIKIDGQPAANRHRQFRQRVGYLPEERGLYKKRKVQDVLSFLGTLKGMRQDQILKRSAILLRRFGLNDYAQKKINALSKGMAQKLQILSCVLHDPDVVILDEPFSGLDPINVRLVRELVIELRSQGKLIFLSTHMMSEVETLCDRILLIHRGKQLLYGSLAEIKKSHTDYDVMFDAHVDTSGLASIARVMPSPLGQRVYLAPGKSINDLMIELGQKGRVVRRMEEGAVPIEELFVTLVGAPAAPSTTGYTP